MNAAGSGSSSVSGKPLTLATLFWGTSVLGLLLALLINNARLRSKLDRLEARVGELEAEGLLLPVEASLSSVGVPLDVDRAMPMPTSGPTR